MPGLGLAMLNSPDPAETAAYQALAVEAAEVSRARDERLAKMTAAQLARRLR